MLKLIGKKFGRLTVIDEAGSKNKRKCWLCECTCGTVIKVPTTNLTTGNSESCGCLHREQLSVRRKSHGHTIGGHSKTYKVWLMMKRRCLVPKSKDYKYYGKRGIKVCTEWLNNFENFLTDMGEKPKDLTIDRIDNNGNYEPSNCKWSTRSEQMQNTRRHKRLI